MSLKNLLPTFFLSGAAAVTGAASPAALAQTNAAIYDFDIAAQNLASALDAFGHACNQQLAFDKALVRDRQSRALRGRYTADAAIARLLEGSGLTFKRTESGVLVVQAPGNLSTALVGPANELEEIVVTAQKRAEKLQDVPISIGVQTAEDLEKFHAVQLSDYAGYIAGLNVQNNGWPGTNLVMLRGLGLLGGNAPLVSIYLDDSPINGSAASDDVAAGYTLPDVNTFDLERVEVLRGPQGTLWGASSVSGMVRYVTVQPDLNRFSARTGVDFITVNKSSERGYSLRGAVNLPLVEGRLALRGSASRTENPGFIDNTFTGRKDGNHSTFDAGGIALLWQATDNLSIKLQARLQRTEANESNTVNFALLPDVNGGTLQGGLIDGNLTNAHALPNSQVNDLQRFALNIDWNLGFADLFSTSSYSLKESNTLTDITDYWRSGILPPLTGVVDGYATARNRTPSRKFVEEIRLASPQDQRVEWILGTFYDDERIVPKTEYFGLSANLSPIAGFSAPLASVSSRSTYKEWALFGNTTYKVTRRLDLTAGLRWAQSKQAFADGPLSGSYFDWCCGGAENPDLLRPHGKSKTDVTSYEASARYHFKDDGMVYARIATGFRPGGPNLISPVAIAVVSDIPSQYKADTDTNYEVGLKSQFLDQHLQLEASLFRIDMTDIQVLGAFLGTDGQTYYATVNGGKVRSDGVELSVGMLPMKELKVTTTAGYSKPVFLNDQLSWGVVKGELVPGASQWTGSIAADYSMPVSAAWTATVGGGVRYLGKHTDYLGAVAASRSSTLTDLNAVFSNDSWRMALYVRNLFDKRAYSVLENNGWNTTAAYGNYYFAKLNQPRTIGLSIDRAF